MSLVKDACKAVGELFILGFNGLELSSETASFLSEARIGGVILFSHNTETPGQIAELTNQIQECRDTLPLWISVDQEGGKVQRFKKGFSRIPEAAAIGATQSPKLAFEISEIIAQELKAVGVNLNFCPVADINTDPKNPVIGNRSFGTTEETVSKFVTAMVRGHLVHGVQPCVKHFPGHGDTLTDSHFALPVVDTSLELLRERELKPFQKAFKSHCSMVMTAHIIVKQVDPKVPATLSKIILQDLLRNELRYDQLIISDDLEMKAITDHFGAQDAPRLALEAGCDLFIYRTQEAAQVGYEALIQALEKGQLNPEWVLRAEHRAKRLKKEVLSRYVPISIPSIADQLATPAFERTLEKVLEHSRKG
ncbi:MAG: beta-N-acetylhexosaminidase [Bdellovibrionia bacterium]